jgi:hypothetical protein
MNHPATSSNADKWIRNAITESALAKKSFEATKVHALNAGWNFIQARIVCERDGSNFTELLAHHEKQISQASAYRYMQFAESALEWAAAEQPSLKGKPAELLKAAYKVVLQSPKPFIALMRQLGEMRKFGEYDAVKYATRKLGTGQQIEFSFDKVSSTLDLLTHLGDPNYVMTFGEGVDEVAAIEQLEVQFETALEKLRAHKQARVPIET